MSSKQMSGAADASCATRSYEKPSIKRIDLALAETLSAACKVTPDQLGCEQDEIGGNSSELGS